MTDSTKSLQSSHSTSYPGFKSGQYEDRRLRDLERAFKEAADIIINDPLMQVFKEKKETQMFMFERIQEIINEGMREANDKYVKEVLLRMEDMNKYNNRLKKELMKVRDGSRDLQIRLQKRQGEYKEHYKSKTKDLEQQIKKLQDLIEVGQTENQKLAEKLSSVKIRNQEILQAAAEKEKGEEAAVNTIKQLEASLENARRETEETAYHKKLAEEDAEELVSKLEARGQEINQLVERMKGMEKEGARLEKVRDEMIGEYTKKIRMLEGKIDELQQDKQALNERVNDNSEFESQKVLIKNLGAEVRGIKDDLIDMQRLKDDLEFSNGQLTQTIQKLKEELSECTSKLSEERKEKHDLEIRVIELSDGNSELNLRNVDLNDQYLSVSQEVKMMKNGAKLTDFLAQF